MTVCLPCVTITTGCVLAVSLTESTMPSRPCAQSRTLRRALTRLAFRTLLAFVALLSVPGPALARCWAPNQQADTTEQENHTPSRPEPTQAARRLGDVPSPEGEHAQRRSKLHRAHARVAAMPPSVVGQHIPRPYKIPFTMLN
jgi:hypothetical protein